MYGLKVLNLKYFFNLSVPKIEWVHPKNKIIYLYENIDKYKKYDII